LRLARRLFGGSVAELGGLAAPLYLIEKPAGGSASPSLAAPRSYARHWTPVHLDFAVDDLDAALARALDAGATLERPPERFPFGRLALLADPFGHGFCLLQFEGRGYAELEV
jgi:predicted enzyme related to lactoylglutathione lyase